jgi:hypothetical protein
MTGHDVLTCAIVMPGISLLEWTPVAGGVRVRCPGCCAEQTVAAGAEVPVFEHGDRGCPVFRQIEAALVAFDLATERHA